MAIVAARRLVAVVPILCLVVLATFTLLELTPGDPAARYVDDISSEEEREVVRERLELDDPFLVRYVSYLGDVLRGDLGDSFTTGRPVWPSIARSIPITLSIVGVALVLAVVCSLAAGFLAAIKRGSWIDRLVTATTSFFLAIPPFVVGLVLVVVVAIKGDWLPATGYESISTGVWNWASYVILPAIAMALPLAAELTRQVRGALIDALEMDYMRTHRAKGLSESVVLGKHAAKSAAAPVITVLGLQAGRVLGAAVVVEAVFAMPGFGSLAFYASLSGDFPMIQGIVLVSAVGVLIINLVTDLTQAAIDPRLRTADAR